MVHREDVTQLRICIPVSAEEEDDDVWLGDGWDPYDDWQAYYDYQDYLAEWREAQILRESENQELLRARGEGQNQLMSDWWWDS